jgi:hypothetical protein
VDDVVATEQLPKDASIAAIATYMRRLRIAAGYEVSNYIPPRTIHNLGRATSFYSGGDAKTMSISTTNDGKSKGLISRGGSRGSSGTILGGTGASTAYVAGIGSGEATEASWGSTFGTPTPSSSASPPPHDVDSNSIVAAPALASGGGGGGSGGSGGSGSGVGDDAEPDYIVCLAGTGSTNAANGATTTGTEAEADYMVAESIKTPVSQG